MQLSRTVICRAAGGGHEFFAFFHAFDKFGRFVFGGDVGADGNFDNIVKTGCFQCADQVVDGAAELADDGRCDHGNDLLVCLMHGFQNINHLRTLDNCAEGA